MYFMEASSAYEGPGGWGGGGRGGGWGGGGGHTSLGYTGIAPDALSTGHPELRAKLESGMGDPRDDYCG